MKTKDVLGIYWDSKIGDVDGQTFYAYSKEKTFVSPLFPLEIWMHIDCKSQKIFGDDWVVYLWDIKFSECPSDWLRKTEKTLLYFIDEGFELSWCGLDGCFSEPPGLFDPDEMSEGVYAAMGRDKNFICHTDFEHDYHSLDSHELLQLRKKIIDL